MSSTTMTVLLGPPLQFTTALGANVIAVGTKIVSNNSWVTSPNGEYVLIFQEDGNLCVYQVIGNPPPFAPGSSFNGQMLWNSGTRGNLNDYCLMQTNGYLCIYPSNGGDPIWSGGVYGTNTAGLFVQDDGNVVINQYSVAWSRNTGSRLNNPKPARKKSQ